jgi:GNAT superfamily N-acetyltransferase
MYWKVPFEWSGDRALPEREQFEDIVWVSAENDQRLIDLVAPVLAASPDASDQANVSAMGSEAAARHLLNAVPSWGCSHKPGWWQLLTFRGADAGFVLPVVYDGCARDGLDEATVFHMGVLPEHRGRGLGRVLLRKAMGTMLEHGVWRIYCDTAAANDPMIHLFESEEWVSLAPHQRPV